ITNLILLKFGDIPEINEKCQNILDIIPYRSILYSQLICDVLGAVLIADITEVFIMVILNHHHLIDGSALNGVLFRGCQMDGGKDSQKKL
ncbi:MAG: hypothetical protein ACFFC1_17690, partial [Promethearchaeota archaeon]